MIAHKPETLRVADMILEAYMAAKNGTLPSRTTLERQFGIRAGAVKVGIDILKDRGDIVITGTGLNCKTMIVKTGQILAIGWDRERFRALASHDHATEIKRRIEIRTASQEFDRTLTAIGYRFSDDPQACRSEPRWTSQADTFAGFREASC